MIENVSGEATRAVMHSLNSLRKSGFLNVCAYNNFGRLQFIVWHGRPTPPRRNKRRPSQPDTHVLGLIRRYFPVD